MRRGRANSIRRKLRSLSIKLGIVLGAVRMVRGRTTQCVKTIGNYRVDLSGLTDTEAPIRYVDPNSPQYVYLATICRSAKMLTECGTSDIVAGVENSCQYHGRSSSEGPYQLIDNDHPSAGVRVTYAGGGKCPNLVPPSYTATFIMRCDPSSTRAQEALVSVHVDSRSCHYTYTFASSAACPVYIGGSGGASSGSDGSGWGLGFAIVVLLLCSYCVAGCVYKSRRYGASGMEMVPHVDALRRALSCVRRLLCACHAKLLGGGRAQMAKEGYARGRPTGEFSRNGGSQDEDVVDFAPRSLLHVENYEEDVKL